MDMVFYRNGDYEVAISPDDGTKIRQWSCDNPLAAFAENVDVKITERCSVGCPFCYEDCRPDGRHADLDSFRFIDHLHPYTEMAINGNDLDHPQLDTFLARLAAQKVICNITVSQQQFMDNFIAISDYRSAGLIHGVGVSFKKFAQDFIDRFLSVRSGVMHVINGIVTPDDIGKLSGYGISLLVLGFKETGRGERFASINRESVDRNSLALREMIPEMVEQFRCICFDNLALEQLRIRDAVTDDEWNRLYMGDDGDFTFYIDLVNGKFARNSIATRRFDIYDRSIDEMFGIIKRLKHYKKTKRIKLWQ